MKRNVKIIRIDKRMFRKFVDHMVLEAEKDKEFKEALKWLDRTSAIKGDFYEKVFQLVFQPITDPMRMRKISRKRMDNFMRDSVWRNGK